MKISIFDPNPNNNYQIVEAIKEEAFKRDFDFDDENPDIIIHIGGDGTFLKAIQNNIDRLDDVIFLGVKNNDSSLGFFYDFGFEDIEDMFDLLDSGLLKINRINLMKCIAESENKTFEFYSFNEIRLSNMETTLKCEIYVNDVLFESYAGDELIISSTSGSTGLNKSAGGAIISSDIDCFQITPLANINSKIFKTINNPLIVNYNSIIKCQNINKNSLISFDYVTLDDCVDNVEISRSNLYVSYLSKSDISFIKKIKDKFDV